MQAEYSDTKATPRPNVLRDATAQMDRAVTSLIDSIPKPLRQPLVWLTFRPYHEASGEYYVHLQVFIPGTIYPYLMRVEVAGGGIFTRLFRTVDDNVYEEVFTYAGPCGFSDSEEGIAKMKALALSKARDFFSSQSDLFE